MGGPDTTGVVRGGGLVLHGALSLQTPVYIYIYMGWKWSTSRTFC